MSGNQQQEERLDGRVLPAKVTVHPMRAGAPQRCASIRIGLSRARNPLHGSPRRKSGHARHRSVLAFRPRHLIVLRHACRRHVARRACSNDVGDKQQARDTGAGSLADPRVRCHLRHYLPKERSKRPRCWPVKSASRLIAALPMPSRPLPPMTAPQALTAG